MESFACQKMGTSFVKYKGNGFWSWDGYLEHLLFLLSQTIAPSPDESWLNEVRDHWREQASGVFGAYIHPNLDVYITDQHRRRVIVELIEHVVSTPGVTKEVSETAQLMKRLLSGEITTDESSPLDYMVNGKHPYEWWVQRNAKMNRNSS